MDFVIIKASTGANGRDGSCRDHHAGFAGVPRGAYHFAMGQDVRQEVANFAAVWRSMPWELDPVLDAEWSPYLSGAVGQANASWVRSFIAEWRRQTGHHRLYVYSGKALLTGELTPARWGADADTPIWAARYFANRADFATLGWEHPFLAIYQYWDKGRVPGIRGDVDLNVTRSTLLTADLVEADDDLQWNTQRPHPDWNDKQQDLESSIDHIDERAYRTYAALTDKTRPSRIPGDDNHTSLEDMIMDSGAWTHQAFAAVVQLATEVAALRADVTAIREAQQ